MGVNRIIVKKNEAKKVIFDALFDAFRPMNFNDIYTVSTSGKCVLIRFVENRMYRLPIFPIV